MIKNSFGEFACVVAPNAEISKQYNAVFRIGKIRPSYAEIVCISDIFKTRFIARKVAISSVRSWTDFIDSCNKIADHEGFSILNRIWSFSCRF